MHTHHPKKKKRIKGEKSKETTCKTLTKYQNKEKLNKTLKQNKWPKFETQKKKK